MGWQVTVFNDCNLQPEGKEFEGVLYKNYWSFNYQDKFDVLWSWRLPELFDLDIDARLKILDLHDVMSVHDFPATRLQNIDKIFVKTNYHRSLFPQVPDEKFVVIGNGINLGRFSQTVKKDPYRFIYSSTPNRGLDIILKSIWPKIKEKLPEAELHVYYGWNTYYRLEKNNPERMAWMKKVQEMMNQAGVVDHGRVGQAELAVEQLKSSFWLYPTYFPEIHCITACEMQASGAIPLTSGYAALEETQLSGLKLQGDVYDPKWQAEFIEKITTLTDEWIQTERAKGIEIAKTFTWDEVATKWHAELN
jgi:glycosyltransferase involved in cell wall biosynthesis